MRFFYRNDTIDPSRRKISALVEPLSLIFSPSARHITGSRSGLQGILGMF